MPTRKAHHQTIPFTESDTDAVLQSIAVVLSTLTIECDAEDAQQADRPEFRRVRIYEALRDRLTAYVESGKPLVHVV